jgi:hypothetical protein
MSVTLKRTVKAYPKPLTYHYLKGFVALSGISESRAISEMIEIFFESRSSEERKNYLEKSSLHSK